MKFQYGIEEDGTISLTQQARDSGELIVKILDMNVGAKLIIKRIE